MNRIVSAFLLAVIACCVAVVLAKSPREAYHGADPFSSAAGKLHRDSRPHHALRKITSPERQQQRSPKPELFSTTNGVTALDANGLSVSLKVGSEKKIKPVARSRSRSLFPRRRRPNTVTDRDDDNNDNADNGNSTPRPPGPVLLALPEVPRPVRRYRPGEVAHQHHQHHHHETHEENDSPAYLDLFLHYFKGA